MLRITTVATKAVKTLKVDKVIPDGLGWSPDGQLFAGSFIEPMGEPTPPVLQIWDGQGNPVMKLETSVVLESWSADSKRILGLSDMGFIIYTLRD